MFKRGLSLLLAGMAFSGLYGWTEEVAVATGLELSVGKVEAEPSAISSKESAGLEVQSGLFSLGVDLSVNGDKKYRSSSNFELGQYFSVDRGVLGFSYEGLTLYGGRGTVQDAIESPYSLFLSSSPQATVFLDFGLRRGGFSYRSTWMQLNYRSPINYEGSTATSHIFDRGMNYKCYALDFGRFRIGYEDSSVYVYDAFDAESFLNPAPTYIQQLAIASSGRPYSQYANPNSLMGLFADYRGEGTKIYAQVLLDDINAGFLAPALGWLIPALNEVRNLQKLAWSIGGSRETPIGTFGLHHGGATKYTFEATYTKSSNYDVSSNGGVESGPDYNTLPYEYTYLPVSTFVEGGTRHTIPWKESYIGYKHGENALSFQVDYSNTLLRGKPAAFDLWLALEYVVSGSKSPNNPWHAHEGWTEIGKTFELLDEAVLAHDLVCSVRMTKTAGNWAFTLDGKAGYQWNRLELLPAAGHPDEAYIWTPVSGASGAIGEISIGATYRFGLLK